MLNDGEDRAPYALVVRWSSRMCSRGPQARVNATQVELKYKIDRLLC